jgi:hypothetical protein
MQGGSQAGERQLMAGDVDDSLGGVNFFFL